MFHSILFKTVFAEFVFNMQYRWHIHGMDVIFSDDCLLYRAIKDPSDSVALQTDIDTLFSWSNIWQMNFNSSKCHILSIGHHRNKIIPSYVLGSTTLSVVDSYPYLGVTISSDLRWEKHITNISAKATKILNFV